MPDQPNAAELPECFWCGNNRRLETYTEGGEVDRWTDCVCVLTEAIARLGGDHDRSRAALAHFEVHHMDGDTPLFVMTDDYMGEWEAAREGASDV